MVAPDLTAGIDGRCFASNGRNGVERMGSIVEGKRPEIIFVFDNLVPNAVEIGALPNLGVGGAFIEMMAFPKQSSKHVDSDRYRSRWSVRNFGDHSGQRDYPPTTPPLTGPLECRAVSTCLLCLYCSVLRRY